MYILQITLYARYIYLHYFSNAKANLFCKYSLRLVSVQNESTSTLTRQGNFTLLPWPIARH